jgi:cardiolipin synthase
MKATTPVSAQCEAGAVSPEPFSLNEVEVLVDGPEAYDAMLAAITQAQHHIHLSMYIYRSVAEGETGQKFAQALCDKVAQGVEVCLVYDPAGSRKAPRAFFEQLRAQGVEVLEYNPVNPLRTRGAWKPNQRDHRKLLIVDGRIAVIGGIDISQHYAKITYEQVENDELRPAKGGWHDVDIRIEGPAVAVLQRTFLETWHQQRGRPLTGNYFPQLPEQGNQQISVLIAHPGTKANAIHTAYLNAIEQAHSSIHLANAYFMPDEEIEEALCHAVKRGVEVTLLLPGVSDFKMVLHGQHYHYATLLKSGVRIYELHEQMMHMKFAVIDHCQSIVGSYNIDMRSFLHAEEVNALIIDGKCAARLEALFQRDIGQAKQVLLEEWEKRPLSRRLKQRLTHRLRYWL